MTVVYSRRYHIDIGAHVFPTAKYHLVADRIRSVHPDAIFVEPTAAAWEALAGVHSSRYLEKIQRGGLSVAELAQLEVPWSREIVEGFRLMTGGTLLAMQLALASSKDDAGAVYHVGGGFHHAFSDHGEGFCLFNDVAVALHASLSDGTITRAAVIDLDVHHGNGTAAIFEADARVFTFSMHQEHNYPAVKPPGSLDVGLPDAADDATYLAKLDAALPVVFDTRPDVVCYLAGADPFVEDQLGGLSLSKAGLRARDRAVLRRCASHGVPAVILLAGGYARRTEDTVDIHASTFDEALEAFRRD